MNRPLFFSLRFVLAISIFIYSCAATNEISSNKSPDFKEKLTKVFLMIKTGKGAKQFAYSFKTQFLTELESSGITCAYYIMDDLALESETDINERINNFHPQVLMTMELTEGKLSQYNIGTSSNLDGGTFDIKIALPKSDRPVWRASLAIYDKNGIEKAVDKSVKTVIEKLRSDGLI